MGSSSEEGKAVLTVKRRNSLTLRNGSTTDTGQPRSKNTSIHIKGGCLASKLFFSVLLLLLLLFSNKLFVKSGGGGVVSKNASGG